MRNAELCYLWADEDFGVVTLEAQSYGRPVIAFGRGGSLESVIGAYASIRRPQVEEGGAITGVFFAEQTADALTNAILSFESSEEIAGRGLSYSRLTGMQVLELYIPSTCTMI